MSKRFSWIFSLVALISLIPETTCGALAETDSKPVDTKIAYESPFYTPEAVEIEQALGFKTLDPQYLHARTLPLALKLLGLSYQLDGTKLFEEVESRLKTYRASTDKPTAINEARAVLHAEPTDSDETIRNRLAVIDLVIQMDPLELTRNPHNPTRNVFLMFPH